MPSRSTSPGWIWIGSLPWTLWVSKCCATHQICQQPWPWHAWFPIHSSVLALPLSVSCHVWLWCTRTGSQAQAAATDRCWTRTTTTTTMRRRRRAPWGWPGGPWLLPPVVASWQLGHAKPPRSHCQAYRLPAVGRLCPYVLVTRPASLNKACQRVSDMASV